MVDVQRHANIKIHTLSEVERVDGEAGHFRVTIREHPRYINMDGLAPVCGDCVQICPVEVYNRFDAGRRGEKGDLQTPSPGGPRPGGSDAEHCIDCGLCYDVCGPQSILHEDAEKEVVIDADAIIVATGTRSSTHG